jgi:hypothetical protein
MIPAIFNGISGNIIPSKCDKFVITLADVTQICDCIGGFYI